LTQTRYDGHLWQGRYKSIIINEDEYLMTCGQYIELNPVKAGMVKKPEEYKWSSYNTYACGANDDLTDYNPIYKGWGRTEQERQKNYRENTKEEMEGVGMNLNAMFIGSDKFIREMEEKFKVSNIKAQRGRPVKVREVKK